MSRTKNEIIGTMAMAVALAVAVVPPCDGLRLDS